MKPKGVIHPCGYKIVSNLEDALVMKQKELAAIFGNVLMKLILKQYIIHSI